MKIINPGRPSVDTRQSLESTASSSANRISQGSFTTGSVARLSDHYNNTSPVVPAFPRHLLARSASASSLSRPGNTGDSETSATSEFELRELPALKMKSLGEEVSEHLGHLGINLRNEDVPAFALPEMNFSSLSADIDKGLKDNETEQKRSQLLNSIANDRNSRIQTERLKTTPSPALSQSSSFSSSYNSPLNSTRPGTAEQISQHIKGLGNIRDKLNQGLSTIQTMSENARPDSPILGGNQTQMSKNSVRQNTIAHEDSMLEARSSLQQEVDLLIDRFYETASESDTSSIRNNTDAPEFFASNPQRASVPTAPGPLRNLAQALPGRPPSIPLPPLPSDSFNAEQKRRENSVGIDLINNNSNVQPRRDSDSTYESSVYSDEEKAARSGLPTSDAQLINGKTSARHSMTGRKENVVPYYQLYVKENEEMSAKRKVPPLKIDTSMKSDFESSDPVSSRIARKASNILKSAATNSSLNSSVLSPTREKFSDLKIRERLGFKKAGESPRNAVPNNPSGHSRNQSDPDVHTRNRLTNNKLSKEFRVSSSAQTARSMEAPQERETQASRMEKILRNPGQTIRNMFRKP